jgi:uncharacterized protein YdaU (DUF1376 family)
VNFYEHHINDYDEATAHLTAVEDGIYSRMIRKYFAKEQPLTGDVPALQRLMRARNDEEKQAVVDILAEFFTLEEDGCYHQKTCDEVLATYVSGAPDRVQKKANENTRLHLHRLQRRRLFQVLNSAGQHAPWNIGIEELRRRVAEIEGPETGDDIGKPAISATRSATAPATPATATQYPLPTTQHIREEGASAREGENPDPSGTTYGAAAKALRSAGIEASPGHQRLRMLVDAGVTIEEFLAHVPNAKDKRNPFAYLLGAVEGDRLQAQQAATQIQHGARVVQHSRKETTAERRARGLKNLIGDQHHDDDRSDDDRTIEAVSRVIG